ncbi:hypothetical protein GCK32_021752 [Trichostrongylus colubriformis]|uniref:Uncharacterized protein n=1 Tax=Trichostrongylus colubriformis TaxID=6319 RepID=A0AAN8FMR5_TRICO
MHLSSSAIDQQSPIESSRRRNLLVHWFWIASEHLGAGFILGRCIHSRSVGLNFR